MTGGIYPEAIETAIARHSDSMVIIGFATLIKADPVKAGGGGYTMPDLDFAVRRGGGALLSRKQSIR